MTNDLKCLLLGALAALGAALALAAPAAENWENHCAKCHGADGKGQTKAGRKLQVKDYTSAAEQAKFTDAEAVRATAEGIRDQAGKERMKGYKDELSPQEIEALVAHVRKFKP
jgi:cytochrome c553